ncbi:MAG TPA: VWA domain-containing protein [Thermoanaerobaculia bacterium]|nr:VWA domain-containing protein [Thermoanaerobaculia bacterium]
MSPRGSLYFFPLLCAAAAAAQSRSPEVRETVQAVLVEVPVRVLDRAGNPVPALTARDFELFDDGKQQAIVGFDAIDLAATARESGAGERVNPAARRHFLILFDLSFARPKAILAARHAAEEFVLSGMGDRDLAAVATYSVETGVRLLVAFSSDRVQLARAIETLGFSRVMETSVDPLAFAFDVAVALGKRSEQLRVGSSARSSAEAETASLTDTLQTMASLSQARADEYARGRVRKTIESFSEIARALNAVQGRKDIIYLSEGFDSRLLVGTRETQQEQDWLLRGETWKVDSDKRFGNSPLQSQLGAMTELFRRSDCVIHAFDIAGLRANDETTGAEHGGTENSLFELAAETGGEVFRNNNDFHAQFGRLISQTNLVYVLAFRPERSGQEGRFHALKVKVRPHGVRVFARAGYYEGKTFRSFTPLERGLSAAAVIAHEISVTDIPMRVLALPYPGEDGRAAVPVLLEISGEALLKDQPTERVAVEIYVYATDSGNRLRDFLAQTVTLDAVQSGQARRGGPVRYYGELSLPAGQYRLRALVRNGRTGRTGSTAVSLSVPELTASQAYVVPPVFLEPPEGGILVRGRTRSVPAERSSAEHPMLEASDQNLVPAASPSVRSGSTARVSLVAYHFGPSGGGEFMRVAGYVLAEDGRPIREASLVLLGRLPSAEDGKQALLLGFTPEGLSPGRYSLRILLQDAATGRSGHAATAFAVP